METQNNNAHNFVVYSEWWEAISMLTNEQRGILLQAMFSASSGLCGMPEMDAITKAVFLLIRPRIVAARTRFSDVTQQEWAGLRDVVFRRDDYTCQYCGQRGGKLECDHVFPFSLGGLSTLDNLVTACRSCNRSKGAKTLSEWRQ